jgi:hypothetical protein
MEKFPTLKPNQTALLRAESATGHVLDEKFDLAISDDQVVFTVFESEQEALIAAKKIISENKNIECIIYGPGENPLHQLDHRTW